MLDAAPVRMQRSRGRAEVTLDTGAGGTRLARLHQSGCAKAMLPRVHGSAPEVVFLNTAGGLTGGDRLTYRASLAPGGRATLTTQTAERAYRSAAGAALVEVDLSAGAGAELRWLPQETILFDGAALDRRTSVRLAGDARLLMVESVVLGRAAMGERVGTLAFHDLRRVWRDGRPIFVEPVSMADAALAAPGPAGLNGHRALATILLAAPAAEDALSAVRAVLAEPEDGALAAATGWDGKLVVGAMARDAWPLRRLVARVLTTLRGGALPRVWQV